MKIALNLENKVNKQKLFIKQKIQKIQKNQNASSDFRRRPTTSDDVR